MTEPDQTKEESVAALKMELRFMGVPERRVPIVVEAYSASSKAYSPSRYIRWLLENGYRVWLTSP